MLISRNDVNWQNNSDYNNNIKTILINANIMRNIEIMKAFDEHGTDTYTKEIK
ncbi:hypothetical protein BCR32DRAFT_280151 [Anaeromyces robustus]|uniref:Uncharacterized protein n=1 Tax=Anaeromyces robustus TaxID=1754192 RepID=A0A1Y1X5I1_9FUNG|nr:hypothetical protein BCR32DRAFT_280151 [Anaeromyces robustus]|eukprot:ORX80905.1 hypothetical protein BCR32DRAFT_280151 [Anaeromyces robustus]